MTINERLLQKIDNEELVTLVVQVKCEACEVIRHHPFEDRKLDKNIPKVINDLYSIATVDGIDLLLCAGCKHSTSNIDLRAIAKRVHRNNEKKSP